METSVKSENAEQSATAEPREARGVDSFRSLCGALIVVALAIGFGKIISVDSVPDRAIQNYRIAQLPRQMEERLKELSERNLSEERFNAEANRIYTALYKDAMKARPTLSANDRSRWSTIRALVEKDARVYRYVPVMTESQKEARVKELAATAGEQGVGEFRYLPNEILVNCPQDAPEKFDPEKVRGKRYSRTLVPYAIDRAWDTPGWDSIDVVKHGLPDEVWEPGNPASGYLYSSKPPLLPTVMAAPYWVLHNVFGLSLKTRPFLTARILLVFYNLVPLGLAFCALARVVELLGKTQWSRFFTLLCALFGYFTLSYVATLNNHVPGFAAIALALWATCEIFCAGKKSWFYYFCAGLFGAFAVVCELPALAFAGMLCLGLLVRRPVKTLLVAIPAGLVVAAAFCETNYIAHHTAIPAYAHKRNHMELEKTAVETGKDDAPAFQFDPNDWYYYMYYPAGRPRKTSSAMLSHWANRDGIDRGEPSTLKYAFHSTVGLRGVFSLTPVWILSLFGGVAWLFARRKRGETTDVGDASNAGAQGFARYLAFMTLTLTVVFFVFFLTRDQGDRNYGGVCCCPRWFFPLAPLFLPCMLPALEWMEKTRLRRGIAYTALFFSVVSVFYPSWNPWTSPWLYQLAVDGGLFTPY